MVQDPGDPQEPCTQIVTVQEAVSVLVGSKTAHRYGFMTFAYCFENFVEIREAVRSRSEYVEIERRQEETVIAVS